MKTLILIPVLALSLAACSAAQKADLRPEISDMTLDGGVMPEIGQVSVPMPPPASAPPRDRAQGASLWQGGSDSFFDDQRASQVGDIVTIHITIDDTARLTNQSSRSREGSASIANPSLFGTRLPGLGGAEEDPEILLELGSEFSRSGEGEISRNERIRLRLAALVVQLLPNGNFVIAGRQEIKVNEEIRELRVAGIVKPQDISPDNSIPYDKIAEARITYGGRGQLSRQQRTGYGEGALNILLPY
jgi:flagellar L-ring protein FlgH